MARTGRPRQFNRDAAVTAAMHLFWEHGYEGASLEQLRQAMGGISSASFYAAFTSKEALYRDVLARYQETHGRVMQALRDRSLPPRDRIEMAMRRSALMQTDKSHPSGCLVTLSATICSDDCTEVQALTAQERAANRQAIHDCVAEAIACGELFDGLLLGLSLQARDGVEKDAMEAAITQALCAWDLNRSDPYR
jgi:AcrR family transcriptional regulator